MANRRAPAQPAEQPEPLAEAQALCNILVWAREHGFAFDTLTVGRVQITAIRDYRPADQDRVRAAAAADAARRDGVGQPLHEEFGMEPPPGVG